MKLEIDISSILYNDAKENRNYISLNKLEIAWKAIADGKPLEQEPTTKNDLGVDCINKADFVKKLESETIGLQSWQKALIYQVMDDCHSVTPQEPQEQQTFKWCTDCKEYDQEKHCCHRWSKVIRDTVEEMKQEQEPILDKVRAEIKAMSGDIETIADVLAIIDKYKAESEG